MEDVFETEARGAILELQLASLAAKHFKNLVNKPRVEISKAPGNGPAWLDTTQGIIFIDERVSGFTKKTTRLLLLHELIHWKLHEENGNPDENEGARFEAELSRLKREAAYTGLL